MAKLTKRIVDAAAARTFNHCVGYAGSSPASVDKSVIVNIIPTFNEK